MVVAVSGSPVARHQLTYPALIFLIILLWALFGILTRPVGHLAAFWPPNAILLGLFVRMPMLASPAGWIAATLAFLTADLMTGSTLEKTLLLTTANLVGVVAGLVFYRRVPEAHVALSRPLSVLIMVGVLVFAAICSAIVGAFVGRRLFDIGYVDGFFFWWATELVNYVAIMPVMLTMPLFRRRRKAESRLALLRRALPELRMLAPFAAVLLSTLVGASVGGPGAIAFPVPALLWASVTYPRFTNAVLSFLFTAVTLIAISEGFLPISLDMRNTHQVLSLRIGVMLIALAPLVVVSVMASRDELLRKFQSLAVTDYLTDMLNRAGFFQLGTATLAELRSRNAPAAVLMIDIDRFKAVNDTHGHPAGDVVLQAIAHTLKDRMRGGDLIGRLGGEEFCILLADPKEDAAQNLAMRLGDAIRQLSIAIPASAPISVTISIGIARDAVGADLNALIATADHALYRAKNEGRDRYIVADPQDALAETAVSPNA